MGILCILSGFIFAVVSLFLPYPGSVSCMVIALRLASTRLKKWMKDNGVKAASLIVNSMRTGDLLDVIDRVN